MFQGQRVVVSHGGNFTLSETALDSFTDSQDEFQPLPTIQGVNILLSQCDYYHTLSLKTPYLSDHIRPKNLII